MNNYTKQIKESNQIAIDIETMPDKSVVGLLPEPSIDSRLKDPDKIEDAKVKAKIEQIEKMALSPLTGKIASIAYYNNEIQEVDIITDDNEIELLNNFWKKIIGKQIITYNGKSFDVPYIFKRGIIHKLEWATIRNMKQYTDRFKSESKHIDVMAEFCDFGKFEKLDNLARFILKGEQKDDFDVTKIAQMITTQEGRDKLRSYNLQDTKLTWDLAKRMGF
jgi:DNA polymerase elongation subunit (family B)